MTKADTLLERLEAVEGDGDELGDRDEYDITCWHRNPDGPEAAALIRELVKALSRVKDRCFVADEANWQGDILDIVVPILDAKAKP